MENSTDTFGLYGDFARRTVMDVWFIVALCVFLGLLCGSWYILRKISAEQKQLDDKIVDDSDHFDMSLWLGTRQYLWNHGDELSHDVFLNELYLLFLDALEASYPELEAAGSMSLQALLAEHSLDDESKHLLQGLYPPLFTHEQWSQEQRKQMLDAVYSKVMGWFPLDDNSDL